VISYLLEHPGINGSQRDESGKVPLHLAAVEDHKEAAQLLINSWEDAKRVRDFDGKTPVELAAKKGHKGMVMFLNHAKPVTPIPQSQEQRAPATSNRLPKETSEISKCRDNDASTSGNLLQHGDFWLGVARVLIISLETRASRLPDLVKDAKKLGLPVEVFNNSAGAGNRSYRSHVLPKFMPDSTCADVLGELTDAHHQALAEAAKAKMPILILEDNVRLPPDFLDSFVERMLELPDNFDVALVGTDAGPTQPFGSSLLLSRIWTSFSGFWAYVVSPEGAKRILKIRRKLTKRKYKDFVPFDVSLSAFLSELNVFVFEPPDHLRRHYESNRDEYQIPEGFRRVGLVSTDFSVTVTTESLDLPEIELILQQLSDAQHTSKHPKAYKIAEAALQRVRSHPCWDEHGGVMPLLKGIGFACLEILATKPKGIKRLGGPNGTLLVSLEALSSYTRYMPRHLQKEEQQGFQTNVEFILRERIRQGFPAVAPPNGWDARVDLSDEAFFHPRTLSFKELARKV